jgi:hypothetical protein
MYHKNEQIVISQQQQPRARNHRYGLPQYLNGITAYTCRTKQLEAIDLEQVIKSEGSYEQQIRSTHPHGALVELAPRVPGRIGSEHEATPSAAGARLLGHLPARISIHTAADAASSSSRRRGLRTFPRPVARVPALEARSACPLSPG